MSTHTNTHFLSNNVKKCFKKKNTFEEFNYPKFSIKDLKKFSFNSNEKNNKN